MRHCYCGCFRHPYKRISHYIIAVICRISRSRVVWRDEVERLAWRLADKHSWHATSTVRGVVSNNDHLVCAFRGDFTHRPESWEMATERAWEEGRQCIALDRDRCDCGRGMALDRYLCAYCHALVRKEYRFDRDRLAINRLRRQLEASIRERRRNVDENKRAA